MNAGANKSVERTRASRSTRFVFVRRRRLAPATHADRQAQATQAMMITEIALVSRAKMDEFRRKHGGVTLATLD